MVRPGIGVRLKKTSIFLRDFPTAPGAARSRLQVASQAERQAANSISILLLFMELCECAMQVQVGGFMCAICLFEIFAEIPAGAKSAAMQSWRMLVRE